MKALDRGPARGEDNFPALLKQHALPVGDERVVLSAAIQQMIMAKVFVERDAAGRALVTAGKISRFPVSTTTSE
jgi:hypothetical protein